jgi:hypothetical protein
VEYCQSISGQDKTGWTVQRLLRIIQVNLFERRTLKALFSPDKEPVNNFV